MSFKSNRNVVYSCKYDVVFCPKYRRTVLVPPIDSASLCQRRGLPIATDSLKLCGGIETSPHKIVVLRTEANGRAGRLSKVWQQDDQRPRSPVRRHRVVLA